MLLCAFMNKTHFFHPWDNRAINGNISPGPCMVWSSITQPASQTAERPNNVQKSTHTHKKKKKGGWKGVEGGGGKIKCIAFDSIFCLWRYEHYNYSTQNFWCCSKRVGNQRCPYHQQLISSSQDQEQLHATYTREAQPEEHPETIAPISAQDSAAPLRNAYFKVL